MKKTKLKKHMAAGEYISKTKRERQTRENNSSNNNSNNNSNKINQWIYIVDSYVSII